MYYYEIRFLNGRLQGIKATLALTELYFPGQIGSWDTIQVKILRRLR